MNRKTEEKTIIAYGPMIGNDIMKFTYKKIRNFDIIKEMSDEITNFGQKWNGKISIINFIDFQKELKNMLDKHSKILSEKEPCEEVIFSFGYIKRKFTKKSGFLEKIKSVFGGLNDKRV